MKKYAILLLNFILFITINNLSAQNSNIKVISPNGGEKLQEGFRYSISWISPQVDRVDIYYSASFQPKWVKLAGNIDAHIGSYSWKVPRIFTPALKIKIVSSNNKDIFDESDQFSFITSSAIPLQKVNSTQGYKKIRIMPMGNSITFDNRVNDPRVVEDKIGYRWPLYNLLTNAGYMFEFVGSEHAGSNFLPAGYDANAGFAGIRDNQLYNLLHTGRWYQPASGIDKQITPGPYLDTYPTDIVLLHIGTNGNDEPGGTSPWDVQDILNQIDAFEESTGTHVTVILARIINRSINENYVTVFNDSVEAMAMDRVNNPSNPHYPDDIRMVDMENIPGFDYTIDSMGTIGDGIPGDMNDLYHPNNKGYSKMSDVWFDALKAVLGTPPSIIQQPVAQGAIEGDNVTFSVTVADTQGIHYQWFKDNVIINSATSSTYEIPNVSLSDNGSVYKCEVYNLGASVFSDGVALVVTGLDQRVTYGSQALYLFNEGTGTTINDSSNVGSPLNLNINLTDKVEWVPFGLKIKSGSSISSTSTASKIFDACTSSNEITIETLILPSQLNQTGPARIITYSKNGNARNFTLAQDDTNFQARLRTTSTTINGIPALNSSNAITQLNPIHVVYVHGKDGTTKIYVNGVEENNTNIGGNFSNWDNSYSLGIGNEFIDSMPWEGIIFYASIFNRALSKTEIEHNYLVGKDGVTQLNSPTNLNGTVNSSNYVELTWQDNSDTESGFIIEGRPSIADSNFSVIDTVTANSTNFTDIKPKHFTPYQYRIIAFTNYIQSEPSDTTTVSVVSSPQNNTTIPKRFILSQNYPNPFNPSTTINYSIPVESNVKLIVYNSIGQVVRELVNQTHSAGNYSVLFDAGNLASGIYYYSFSAISFKKSRNFSDVKKLVLIK